MTEAVGHADDPMTGFVICINNNSNPASLILGKVYRTLPRMQTRRGNNMVRVVDEDRSEPDGYLFGPLARLAGPRLLSLGR
jgi:hypothetical protein